MGRRFSLVILVLALSLLAAQMTAADAAEPENKVRVFVSILPQATFVEKVGGDRVEVDVLVGPGQSPATYAVTHKQMARLAKAQVYFRIGVPFEGALLKKVAAALPELRIVDTRKGIKLRVMKGTQDRGHEHGDEDKQKRGQDDDVKDEEHKATDEAPRKGHNKEGSDPHTWLNPRMVKTQVRTICEELVGIDPAHADKYRKNAKAFEAELERVDSRIARVLAPLKGSEFFAFHPAYGYFGDAYGLKQVAVEVEGKSPSPKQLVALVNKAREANVKVIFVQPQFATTKAQAIARAIGGVVVPLDPLARDYLKNLVAMAGKLERGLARPATEEEGRGDE